MVGFAKAPRNGSTPSARYFAQSRMDCHVGLTPADACMKSIFPTAGIFMGQASNWSRFHYARMGKTNRLPCTIAMAIGSVGLAWQALRFTFLIVCFGERQP